jgi:hypothetical protein
MDKLQPSFSGGVIEPGIHHRNDLQQVAYGLKTSENAIIDQNGNWLTRPGTHYHGTTLLSSGAGEKQSILIPFKYDDDENYMIEITDGNFACLNYDLTKLKIPNVAHDATVWMPYGHRNRPNYGSYKPHQFVLTARSWNISYNNGVGSPWLILHMSFTDMNTTGINVLAQTNTSDTLEVTHDSDTVYIKFANTTASKNTLELIEEAIQESSSSFIIDNTAVGFATAWVIGSDDWNGDFSNPSSLTTTDRYEWGLRRLNADCTDYYSQTYTPGADLVVATDYVESDLPNIRYVRTGDSIYFADGNRKPKIFTFYDTDNYYFADIDFRAEPFGSGELFAVLSGGFGSNWELRDPNIDVNDLIGQQVRAQTYIGQVDLSVELVPSIGVTDPLPSQGMINYTITGVTDETDYGYLRLEYTLDGINWTDTGALLTGGVSGFHDYGEHVHFRIKNETESTFTASIQVVGHLHMGYGIVTSTDSTWSDEWAIVTPITLFPYTSDDRCDIRYSQWSDDKGWPETVYIFQNRLGFGASRTYPITRWESETGNFLNFNPSAAIVASDPTSIDLPATHPEHIRNIVAFYDMAIITDSGCWIVQPDPAGYGPLNAALPRKISSAGTARVPAILANQTVVFVSRAGTSIKAFRFDNAQQGYSAMTISDHAKHLFTGYQITGIVYQPEPWGIIWLVRSDGKVISLTFNDTSGMLAYSLHNFGGIVENLTVYSDDADVLFMTIVRNSVRYVEYLDMRNFTGTIDAFFVDCGTEFNEVAPTNTFTGLARLNGQAVAVLADGWKITGKTVSAGTLTLDTIASDVIVGIPYTSIFEPIHPVIDRKTGSGHAVPQNVRETKVLYANTIGGEYGYDSASLEPMPEQRTDPTEYPDIFSDWIPHSLRTYTTDDSNLSAAQFYFRQVSPYPAEILAIIPDIE